MNAAAAAAASGGASLYHLDLRQKRTAGRLDLGGGREGGRGGSGGGGGREGGRGGRRGGGREGGRGGLITGKHYPLSTGRVPVGLVGPEKPLVGGGREGGEKGRHAFLFDRNADLNTHPSLCTYTYSDDVSGGPGGTGRSCWQARSRAGGRAGGRKGWLCV